MRAGVVGVMAAAALCVVAGCSSGAPSVQESPSVSPSTAPASTPATTPTPTARPRPAETAEPTETTDPSAEPTRNPLADLVEGIDVPEGPVLGADMSWPQCPEGMGIPEKRSSGQPLPMAQARFIVLGLTNGPGFYPNPCLASQVSYVRERRLLVAAYSVASYPEARFIAQHGQDGPYDGTTRLGALANTGYQQALFNVRSMRAAGLETPIVWVDVEPVPKFPWSGDTEANATVVGGIVRGYRASGYEIGIYSTPSLWDGVVGDLELGVPEWRAAGQTSSDAALEKCGDEWSIQGGQAVMGQWVQYRRDMNLTCPGISDDLAAWFHLY